MASFNRDRGNIAPRYQIVRVPTGNVNPFEVRAGGKFLRFAGTLPRGLAGNAFIRFENPNQPELLIEIGRASCRERV